MSLTLRPDLFPFSYYPSRDRVVDLLPPLGRGSMDCFWMADHHPERWIMKPKGYVGRCSILKTLCRKTAGR